MAGLEQRFPAPEAGGLAIFPTPQEVPSGSSRTFAMARREAAITSWALRPSPNCQRDPEHRAGVEPTSPPYESGVLPAIPPVHASSGTEGLEPSPAWLRARCAAANTLVPTIANSRPGRSRTSIFRLSADALPLSYRPCLMTAAFDSPPRMGPEGLEPHFPA